MGCTSVGPDSVDDLDGDDVDDDVSMASLSEFAVTVDPFSWVPFVWLLCDAGVVGVMSICFVESSLGVSVGRKESTNDLTLDSRLHNSVIMYLSVEQLSQYHRRFRILLKYTTSTFLYSLFSNARQEM